MSTTKTPLSQIISLADLAWQERQPGVRAKAIWEHPESQRKAVMTRIAPGAKLPLHRHVGDELVFVIEGAISDEFGTVTAGNVGYRPNGCVHTVTTKNGATVLAVVWGRTEPV
jgi:anti-sigma factor ChrR (cupin superfamily)